MPIRIRFHLNNESKNIPSDTNNESQSWFRWNVIVSSLSRVSPQSNLIGFLSPVFFNIFLRPEEPFLFVDKASFSGLN